MSKRWSGRVCDLRGVASGLAVGWVALSPSIAWGAKHTFPGAAPCNRTLQACIDAARPGDRIEIATSAPIAEDLTILKSLAVTAAPGSTPHLGGEHSPRTQALQVTVGVAPSGATTNVTFSHLSFDADITVSFDRGAGHSFVFDHSTIERHWADVPSALAQFPGTTPLDFTDNALLKISTSVPASVIVSDSTFIAAGGNVELHAQAAKGVPIGFDVVRSRFIGAECCGGEFDSTVLLDLQGGHVTANVANNLMHRRAAGSPAFHVGIFESDASAAFSGNVYVTSNTFDDAVEPGNSLETSPGDPMTPHSEGQVSGLFVQADRSDFIHLYDNVFSYLTFDTFYTVIADAANNDFFSIATPAWPGFPRASAQLSVDPGYFSYARDFHLQRSSRLVDAGFNRPPGGLQRTDLDGNRRIFGRNVDIGAYEYTAPRLDEVYVSNEPAAGAGNEDDAADQPEPTTAGSGGGTAALPGAGEPSVDAGANEARAGGASSSGLNGPDPITGGCALRGGASAAHGWMLLSVVAALLGRRRRQPARG